MIRLGLAALALCAAACAHPYRAPAGPEAATALVRIETHDAAFARFEVFSTFHIDVRVYGENECPSRWTDGGTYLGRIELDREGGSEEVRVPTERRVNFWASYSSQTLGASISCSLFYAFVPEAGHSYVLQYSGDRRGCQVVAQDQTTASPVALMGRRDCPQSL